MGEITAFTSKLPSSIDVKWGLGDDPSMGDKVKVTVLASGFDVTIREANKGGSADSAGGTIVMTANSQPEQPKPIDKQKEEDEQIAQIYGHKKIMERKREADKMKYAVLKPSQFDDHEIIALIERTPALNRTPRFFEELNRLSNPQEPASAPQHRPVEETNNGGKTIKFGF
jgi:cell division protein FtsZ